MPTSPFSDWELDLACVRPWHSPSTRSAAPSPAPEHDRNLLLEPLAAQGKATEVLAKLRIEAGFC
jgi:hypothetical protein